MIFDGYNDIVMVAGRVVVYRPLTREARKQVVGMAAGMPESAARAFLRDMARLRVQYGDPGVIDWGMCKLLLGRLTVAQQKEDKANLLSGLEVALEYPHLIEADACTRCKHWWFDPEAGRVQRREGKAIRRTDEPLACDLGLCPLGHWKNPRRLSQRNRMAYEHFLHCRATGSWPDDDIVRRNAKLIEGVIRGHERVGRGIGVVGAGDGAGRSSRAGSCRHAGASGAARGVGRADAERGGWPVPGIIHAAGASV